jgi:hypothetical protein
VTDRHGWNSWENYRALHEKRVTEHPFVLDHIFEWTIVGDRDFPDQIQLSGQIFCEEGVHLHVTKMLATRVRNNRLQVQAERYSYNAFFVGRHNILRYDNGHLESPDEFHRHLFDVKTGEEIERTLLTRDRLPLLHEILTEVQGLVTAGRERSA